MIKSTIFNFRIMDQKICRICCDKDGNIYLFDTSDSLQISAKIMYCCASISIVKDDGLPTYICEQCHTELEASYRFVLKCEDADKKLRAPQYVQKKHDDINMKLEVKSEDFDNYSLDGSVDDCTPINDLKSELKLENTKEDYLKQKDNFKSRRKKSKNNGPKKCNVCSRVCANTSTFIIHMRTHTNEKPYPCPSCDKRYKDRGSLKRHMERNHLKDKRTRNFICELCGKGFFSKTDVKTHMRIHTGETPYACSVCPSRFSQLCTLLRHQKRHTGERSHMCTICNKKFCTKEELKTHNLVHSNEKRYSCPLCNIPFKYRNNLKKHIRSHSEPNSFVCNHCGKTFNVKGNLKVHIDRQHSSKSGFCNLCSKYVANIEAHTWRHTGERPLKCELCASSFFAQRALARHINFRHKQTDKFKCTVEGCKVAFPSQPMLDFHTAKLHGTVIPYPCDRCSRGFYRKNDLSRHKIGTHKEKLDL